MDYLTYKDSGVDRNLLSAFKNSIIKINTKDLPSFLISSIGKFSSIVNIPENLKEPQILISVDGIGTKTRLNSRYDLQKLCGYDIVNHSVNDIISMGGLPYYFLDMIAFSTLTDGNLFDIGLGISSACLENNIYLVGGETSHMPDYYKDNDFELIGIILGFVEKDSIIDGIKIKKSDAIIGLPSDGIHTNGFSLISKVFNDNSNIKLDDEFDGKYLWQTLLEPHKSYLYQTRMLIKRFEINGMAHITGGGIYENINRILPEGLNAKINFENIPEQKIFDLIKNTGNIKNDEMIKTFNMGVGFAYIVNKIDADEIIRFLKSIGENPFELGYID